MVERPIKKAELAARKAQEGDTDREARSDDRRDRKGRKGGKGKGRRDREEKAPPVSPALMRGPRPKPKVEEPEPQVEQPVVEEPVAEELAAAAQRRRMQACGIVAQLGAQNHER